MESPSIGSLKDSGRSCFHHHKTQNQSYSCILADRGLYLKFKNHCHGSKELVEETGEDETKD